MDAQAFAGLWPRKDSHVIPLFSVAFTVTFQDAEWSHVMIFRENFVWLSLAANPCQSVALGGDRGFANVI